MANEFVFAVNDARWVRELERLARPSFQTVQQLERVLTDGFEQSQVDAHVISGSLRGSGKTSSELSADGEWTGTIEYGGDSPGFPNDPVVYAIYEMARGGDHDFLRNVPPIIDQVQGIVEDHLRG